MRLKGKLKSWNDDRGFGFIHPIQGGEEIFVHIKALSARTSRPQVNELFWFEIELGPDGRKRAKNVEVVRRAAGHSKPHVEQSTRHGSATLLAIPGFLVLYSFVEIAWQPPLVLAAIYVLASAITYLTYFKDKAAAQRNEWRTPEATLHLLGFAGGWPGALIAQQVLRHKSRKPEFRACFWATVVLNVGGFVLFCSPVGQSLLANLK